MRPLGEQEPNIDGLSRSDWYVDTGGHSDDVTIFAVHTSACAVRFTKNQTITINQTLRGSWIDFNNLKSYSIQASKSALIYELD